jgi:hypothetical protein
LGLSTPHRLRTPAILAQPCVACRLQCVRCGTARFAICIQIGPVADVKLVLTGSRMSFIPTTTASGG